VSCAVRVNDLLLLLLLLLSKNKLAFHDQHKTVQRNIQGQGTR